MPITCKSSGVFLRFDLRPLEQSFSQVCVSSTQDKNAPLAWVNPYLKHVRWMKHWFVIKKTEYTSISCRSIKMNLTIKSKNQLIIATKKTKQLNMQYGHRCNEFGSRLYFDNEKLYLLTTSWYYKYFCQNQLVPIQ